MPEAHIVLIVVLSAVGLVGSAWLALFVIVQAKNRMLREHRRTLEAERLATLTRQAFMDNAHHELKTPLQIIQGNLDILQALVQDPDAQKCVNRSQAASRRLQTLVQGLLDLTDLADGTYAVHPGPIELPRLLEAFATDAHERAHAKGLAFNTEWDFQVRAAWVDDAALVRILNCLMDNAIAYTDKGQITLRGETTLEGHVVRLVVEIDDTGWGLPEDSHGTLLEPFLQGRQTLSKPGVLGLGLPLAAALTRHLGGELDLARLFPGTRARIQIPLPQAQV